MGAHTVKLGNVMPIKYEIIIHHGQPITLGTIVDIHRLMASAIQLQTIESVGQLSLPDEIASLIVAYVNANVSETIWFEQITPGSTKIKGHLIGAMIWLSGILAGDVIIQTQVWKETSREIVRTIDAGTKATDQAAQEFVEYLGRVAESQRNDPDPMRVEAYIEGDVVRIRVTPSRRQAGVEQNPRKPQ